MKKRLLFKAFVPAAAILVTACQPLTVFPADDAGQTQMPPADATDDTTDFATCESDTDCEFLADDTGGCVEALCDFGFCGVRIQPAGHPCDDGSNLTSGDVCDGEGECAGQSTECGDARCDLEKESCYTCPPDCACTAGMLCYDGQCVPEPADGDGVCEWLEDCGISPLDCTCPDDSTCVDAECMPCDDACAQDHRVCGDLDDCECGECDGGLACTFDGQCAIPGECGDDECLTSFEDCDTCPVDCACTDTQGCADGVCKACSTICRGIECGVVYGCDCGETAICQQCSDGTLSTDCVCLCASQGMECGKTGGCICGDYEGGCMERLECVDGLCMPDCDMVCDDLECGAIGNCLCARCAKDQVCYDGTCRNAIFDPDEYEPNDYPGDAALLGAFTDADGTPEWDVVGAILLPEDRDWYTFNVDDTWGEILDIRVVLDGMSEDADLNLMVCYRCDYQPLLDPGLSVFDDAFEVASTINDARCFESRRKWGMADAVSLAPVCGIGFDDSGTVWMKVYPAEKADARTDYLLGFDL